MEFRDGVAVLTIDNPPVNALGASVLAVLIGEVDEAERRDDVRAIVLRGANGTFSGGADMRAFSGAPATPTLRDAIARVEAARKPIVVAICGNALGGGLELALAADRRVASPEARIGLPEIARGLLPGAGGTQRLPRLLGLGAALEVILSGTPRAGAEALAVGLVDEISDDPESRGVELAREIAAQPRRIVGAMDVRPDDEAVARARKRAEPIERGGLAAHRAIDAVAASATMSLTDGLVFERKLFDELLASHQSKARLHLFFAEREAAKSPVKMTSQPIRRVAVIGSGTMGTGIAMACANAGIEVAISDTDSAALERADARIRDTYAASVQKRKLTQSVMDERCARVQFVGAIEQAMPVDLVIEAVFEQMSVKLDVFRALDRATSTPTLLATNTSTLDVDAIAEITSRPPDFVGLHFFSPANVMRLLEIVRGRDTSEESIARALAFAKQIGKVAVVSGNCDGFIGNRMLAPYRREAEFLLEEGASPQQVDAALVRFGFAMGPFAVSDLAGLDIGWNIRKRRNAERPPVGRYSRIGDTLCEMGRFGQKTGAGYYRYEAGNRKPLPDPLVDEVIERCSTADGIVRRTIGDDEIVQRCLYALVNEGAAIVGEGIAARPGDVDVVWVNGYGFPAFRGGPLWWADNVGLAAIVARMRDFERTHGAMWKPAALLTELADNGATFAALPARAPVLA